MSSATSDYSEIEKASKEYEAVNDTLQEKYKRWEELAI